MNEHQTQENEEEGNENEENQGFKWPKIPQLITLMKKPKLKPEVIELEIPRGEDEPSSSSHVIREDVNENEAQNSGVFDTHIAVIYDRYVNFKERLRNKIRDKIMKFMRDDLDNADNEQDLDVEGGLSQREPDSTYDGIILIVTVLLGFILQLPFMWIIGSFLFLVYGNFKPKIIKWGIINLGLSILSIIYAAQLWDFTDPEIFRIKYRIRSVLLSKHHHTRGVPGVLKYEDKDSLEMTFVGNKDLKWSIIHNKSEHSLKHGNFSDILLVNSKLIPKSTDMIRLNHEILVKGLVQLSVKFQTKHTRSPEPQEIPNSHHYPLHHKPSDEPFDLSFECYSIEDKSLNELSENKNKENKVNLEEVTEENKGKYGIGGHLKGSKGDKSGSNFKEESKKDEVSPVDLKGNEIVKVEKVEESSENNNNNNNNNNHNNNDNNNNNNNSEEVGNVEEEEGQEKGKKYIGVDAFESGVFVTRLFTVSRLSKCSLVYVPKEGTDVVAVKIKRLQ